ncbi:gamma-glutamyltransferase [Kineococcus sp. NUM-3379]
MPGAALPLLVTCALLAPGAPATAAPATAAPDGAAALRELERTTPALRRPEPPRQAVAVGTGGAVASVDPEATRIGLDVLRRGGNAVDAAVATAAALGVTEPYSAGIGGGGFFTYLDASTGRVHALDGRETAPAALRENSFTDASGKPLPFPEVVSSTLSVGVPGTPATWEEALRRWGSRPLPELLAAPAVLAARGFTVDQTFHDQTAANAARFAEFTSTAELFLPGGAPPAVGSTFRNPGLARTYAEIALGGVEEVYRGDIAGDIVDTVARPPVAPGVTRTVRTGGMTRADLEAYTAPERPATRVRYRGLDVWGFPPPSSGGTTVGEALNILESSPLATMSGTQAAHHVLEASALAFADRNRWVGDPDVQDVPTRSLLSQAFADSRACLVDPTRTLPRPVAPGSLRYGESACESAGTGTATGYEGDSTTHLVTSDREGNVVSYTLTIEQTGGSGIVVPGRGFILNNELTDFSFTPVVAGQPDPNLPGPGKRPRSSMAPTIVLRDGEPLLALGSPGGATIITTVLQVLVDRLDRGASLPEAVARPRVSERNNATANAEPEFIASPLGAELRALGHAYTPTAEIGAVAALEFLPGGTVQAVAEPRRRGGGAAGVVRPGRR